MHLAILGAIGKIGHQRREFAQRRLVNFAITLAADGSLLGSIGLKLDRETPGAGELGYEGMRRAVDVLADICVGIAFAREELGI